MYERPKKGQLSRKQSLRKLKSGQLIDRQFGPLKYDEKTEQIAIRDFTIREHPYFFVQSISCSALLRVIALQFM
jgi:hypothetical protein